MRREAEKGEAMTVSVYERLAQHLDELPAGYPRTDSGVELRILRRLFTPEEAELALHLSLIEEEARVIARRAKIPVEEAARRLEEMEKKGLVFVYRRAGKAPRYLATPFAVGFYEFQVNRLNPESAQDYEEYMDAAWDNDLWQKAPQLRTIPVGESISVQTEVLPYERAEDLVRVQDKFAVAPCVCRRERRSRAGWRSGRGSCRAWSSRLRPRRRRPATQMTAATRCRGGWRRLFAPWPRRRPARRVGPALRRRRPARRPARPGPISRGPWDGRPRRVPRRTRP